MKRSLALLLALIMCIGLLAGCAKEPAADPSGSGSGTTGTETPSGSGTGSTEPTTGGTTTTEPTTGGTTTTEPEKPKEPKILREIRTAEDTTMNVYYSTLTADAYNVYLLIGRLYNLFPKADGSGTELIPEYADGEPTSDDGGYTWRIKLKKNGQWPNGEPITADDWIYSWKQALDPVMMYSSGSNITKTTNSGVEVVNAYAYWNQSVTGTPVNWEDVGYKKVDDYTVELQLVARVTAFDVMRFLQSRYASVVNETLYEKCRSADGKSTTYGTSVDTVMFCGAYLLESWTKALDFTMVKNETWVMSDYIKLDGIYSRVVLDEGTQMELFESGQCDFINLGLNGLAKYEEDPRTRAYSANSIKALEFNRNHTDATKKALFCDPDFRKAIFYAIDRDAIAKLSQKIAAPFNVSYLATLSTGELYRHSEAGKAIVEKYAPNGGYDAKLANEYLDKALQKLGLTSISVQLTYDETNSVYRKASEYMQADFVKVFGDKLVLTLQANTSLPALMRSSKKTANDSWELCWSGWSNSNETEYPCTVMSFYRSSYGNKYTLYANDVLDAAYTQYQTEEARLNPSIRDELVTTMEEAMYEDMTRVPVYQEASFTVFSDRLTPALNNYAGQIKWGCAWGDIKQ